MANHVQVYAAFYTLSEFRVFSLDLEAVVAAALLVSCLHPLNLVVSGVIKLNSNLVEVTHKVRAGALL